MTRKVSVIIEKDEAGFYAYFPELPGCQTQGNTHPEVMKNIKEAIDLYLEASGGGECRRVPPIPPNPPLRSPPPQPNPPPPPPPPP
ncbi:MAG: type II toxin-antitoxin system HicB family antitoxin, partial [Sphingobacteriaceae bacterium]